MTPKSILAAMFAVLAAPAYAFDAADYIDATRCLPVSNGFSQCLIEQQNKCVSRADGDQDNLAECSYRFSQDAASSAYYLQETLMALTFEKAKAVLAVFPPNKAVEAQVKLKAELLERQQALPILRADLAAMCGTLKTDWEVNVAYQHIDEIMKSGNINDEALRQTKMFKDQGCYAVADLQVLDMQLAIYGSDMNPLDERLNFAVECAIEQSSNKRACKKLPDFSLKIEKPEG